MANPTSIASQGAAADEWTTVSYKKSKSEKKAAAQASGPRWRSWVVATSNEPDTRSRTPTPAPPPRPLPLPTQASATKATSGEIPGDADRARRMNAVVDLDFGFGKYQCLGKPIAMMELNKIFVELLRRYDFTIVNPQSPIKAWSAIFWVANDFWLRITKRDTFKPARGDWCVVKG
ncbi:hypothetical protein NUW58_g6437 [Xylaria curta]|uniref:Uncharacterized protein n=1 Tax=Xylaria curta TaxID=42375 RepID=A0ACC1NV53_9PEZI|nr:hypothetical protein NUW58_g6437 [Xylaria curta]